MTLEPEKEMEKFASLIVTSKVSPRLNDKDETFHFL